MFQHATDPDLIRRRAYELWLERGRPDGSADRDWLSAERELLAAAATSEAAPAPQRTKLEAPMAAKSAAPESAPSKVSIPRPRRSRSIVTRSPAAPAAQLLNALSAAETDVPVESGPRATKAAGARAERRGPQKQKRSA